MAKKQSWTEMDKSKTPFSELRTAFRFYNQTAGRSPHTLKWYDDRLTWFERFLGEKAVLSDLTIPTVRAFIADLQSKGVRHANNRFVINKEGSLSSSYIQGFARALRAFSSWLYEDGYTDTNILRALRPPKVTQKVIVVLSDKEIERLLKSFNRDEPFGARNYAIVITMLDCGLRASELCGLTRDGVRLDDGFLKVLGKGDKERLVPMGQAAQLALKQWRDRFRPQFQPSESEDCFFLGADSRRMKVNGLEQMVANAGQRARLDGLHPHKLRHTFATRFLTEGLGDAFQLQQLLGHTSLEMVRRYVSLASIERSLLQRRPSPMDRLALSKANEALVRRVQAPKRRQLRLVK